MLHKTKGIVLHTIKYGDSSIISNIYTRDYGRQSYLVHGVRGKKSKFHFNYFQPLTILEIQVDHKINRELQRIRELHISHPFHHLHTNIVKNTIALFIGEVLYRSLRDTEGNIPLFNYLEGAIQILDFCEKGCNNFHLIFLMQFTRFLGIYPENFTELDTYQPQDSKLLLSELIVVRLKDLPDFSIDHRSRELLIKALLEYYHFHIEGMGKITSLSVLQEVFS